jgi:hypothetical protein
MKTNAFFATATLTLFASISGAQTAQSWMSADVAAAWAKGYKGQGTTITVVDDFRSSSVFSGKLTSSVQIGRHGQWTATEASLIAPLAAIRGQDYTSGTAVPLAKGLNVINLVPTVWCKTNF